MKAVILCGGKGMRLHEETEFKPKPLINIGDRPILWHIMKTYAHYGVRDFILCLGYKGQMIKDYFLNFDEHHNDFTLTLGSGEKKISYHTKKAADNWNITFVDTGANTNTGGRIARIKSFLGEDKEFFLTYGDGVADINIDKLYKFHKKSGRSITLSGVQPLMPFGIIEPAGGVVKSFEEKPKNKKGVINGGFYVCDRRVFNYLTPDERCVFESDSLPAIAKKGQLAVYSHRGFWHCMDTHKHMEDLNVMYQIGDRPWAIWE
ncbi:MAG: glucose-1-phosphate cytidylyltransferase [bacterium]|nr:glucose-1-phosphate cytidylyltransferase [bacterium]